MAEDAAEDNAEELPTHRWHVPMQLGVPQEPDDSTWQLGAPTVWHIPPTITLEQLYPAGQFCHCAEEAEEEGTAEDTADELAEEEHCVSVEMDVPRLLVTTNLPPPKYTPKT